MLKQEIWTKEQEINRLKIENDEKIRLRNREMDRSVDRTSNNSNAIRLSSFKVNFRGPNSNNMMNEL